MGLAIHAYFAIGSMAHARYRNSPQNENPAYYLILLPRLMIPFKNSQSTTDNGEEFPCPSSGSDRDVASRLEHGVYVRAQALLGSVTPSMAECAGCGYPLKGLHENSSCPLVYICLAISSY